MRFVIEAACGCHIGNIRKTNEDNFYFEEKCLAANQNGLRNPVSFERPLTSGLCLAVFDGMGGENYGELASFAAARQLQQTQRTMTDFFVPEKKYLLQLTQQLNNAVVQKKEELLTEKMGTTMVALYFTNRRVYVCNVGDSRAYRLRDGEFLQISLDHTEKRPGREGRKAPLTQHLGIAPEDMLLEPHIAKGDLAAGDIYLLCSDGLTDMLTNFEIADILLQCPNTEACAQTLLQAALANGGKDNVTVIVCKIL